jgi:peroxiredoxin
LQFGLSFSIFFPEDFSAEEAFTTEAGMMSLREIQPGTVRARELYGDFWFNTEAIPLSALRGGVVVLFFWDFAFAASLRALPYLVGWRDRYLESGCTVIGVHAPRLPFARDPEEVRNAIERMHIDFPVVVDNESLIATHYDCRTLPEIILIDKDGFIRYRSTGEGQYAAVEHALQALLYQAGVGGEMPLVMEPVRESEGKGVVCFRATPDIFTGYVRGSLGNVEGYSPESGVRYEDPGVYLDGRFYAEGEWMNGRDAFTLLSEPENTGHLRIGYRGLEAEGVLGPEGKGSVQVTVRQDNAYLSEENRGEDIRTDGNGRSYLVVDRPRVYQLVRNREFGEHLLWLSGEAGSFSAYGFSFTTAPVPELISKN